MANSINQKILNLYSVAFPYLVKAFKASRIGLFCFRSRNIIQVLKFKQEKSQKTEQNGRNSFLTQICITVPQHLGFKLWYKVTRMSLELKRALVVHYNCLPFPMGHTIFRCSNVNTIALQAILVVKTVKLVFVN